MFAIASPPRIPHAVAATSLNSLARIKVRLVFFSFIVPQFILTTPIRLGSLKNARRQPKCSRLVCAFICILLAHLFCIVSLPFICSSAFPLPKYNSTSFDSSLHHGPNLLKRRQYCIAWQSTMLCRCR
jgi:hypothetical protein